MEFVTSLASTAVLGIGSPDSLSYTPIKNLRDLCINGSKSACDSWPGFAD